MWSSERLVLLVATLVLSACGFRLQGSDPLPPELSRTYINTADPYSGFHRELVAALEARGVEVTQDPAQARSVIDISRDETGQRVLSVSARNVPREFEIFYTVSYSLRTAEATLLEPRSLTLTRDYTWRETEVLGKKREEAMLREALTEDLARQVIRQLASIE